MALADVFAGGEDDCPFAGGPGGADAVGAFGVEHSFVALEPGDFGAVEEVVAGAGVLVEEAVVVLGREGLGADGDAGGGVQEVGGQGGVLREVFAG